VSEKPSKSPKKLAKTALPERIIIEQGTELHDIALRV
jgi:hypothetical protein